MPQELRDYQDEIGLTSNQTDHKKAIRERLKTIRDLFHFGRYRPRAGGVYKVTAGENAGGLNAENDEKAKKEATSPSGPRAGSRGDIYALFAEVTGSDADLVDSSTDPEARWVTTTDGSRSAGDLEDRAARYLPDQNLLLINGDFRAFTDMIDRGLIATQMSPDVGQLFLM